MPLHSCTASSCSIHGCQLMQHSRTASSCSIHAPPAHAAFTHRQLMQHSRTASSCSIHAPPACAAFTHRSCSIHAPPVPNTHLLGSKVNPGNCQIVHRSLHLRLGGQDGGRATRNSPLAWFWSRPETEKVISVREGVCGG